MGGARSPDVDEWLQQFNVQIRGTGEWLMAVQYESVGDELVVPHRGGL